jgi:L-amino acid N-acyltransferase YncA
MATPRSAWQVALDSSERVTGFQWIEPSIDRPDEAAEIATFVQLGQGGLGIGSALFEATRRAAKELGYRIILATIRADNEGGLIYYQSRGFMDWGLLEGVPLENGTRVDKRIKRFEL